MGRNTKGDLADVVVQQNASFNIQIASLSEVVASNFFHVSIGRKSEFDWEKAGMSKKRLKMHSC